jgi:hypothetical protein
MSRDRHTATWPVQSLKANIDLSLALQPGLTQYQPIQELTPQMPSNLSMQQPSTYSTSRSTRCRDYLSIEEVGKELSLYAVGNNALAPLKKQYIDFGDTTILAMIDHLRLSMAIRMLLHK